MQEPLSDLVNILVCSGIYNKWVDDELIVFGNKLRGPGFALKRKR